MKLDLVEIRELSPPGLWDLGILSAFISTLISFIEAGVGGARSVRLYTRMVAHHSKELRIKTQENLGMRIKVWVMQCPYRIAWVRGTIGEAAIRRWRKNRLADYALSKYFGDWKRKFPHGLETGFKKTHKKKARNLVRLQKLRAYNWKLFSLTKILNVEGFLNKQSENDPEIVELYAADRKLCCVGFLGNTKSIQPRSKRNFKPIEFTPYELVPESATCAVNNQEGIIIKEGKITVISPPKKLRCKSAHSPPHSTVPTTNRAPPTKTHDSFY